MSLSKGTRLGPYEILELLGAGGMGEVYRARDTRLDRAVALKVCASQFMQRFDREARSIAALNHPHICSLYDVGPNYLVMELVEGPTLSSRLQFGPIPLKEALKIALQIVDALQAAHEKGIVHRDLKPANIKFNAAGDVKVLDFGLAKVLEADSSTADASISPTLTLSATRAGVILGTAAYMSPEQARGVAADKRCDIWAFAIVLYEMLTSRRAFDEETVSDTLAAVLKTNPDWSVLPAGTPLPIRRLLRRCLDRDRKRRLQDIGDARLEIDDALAGVDESARPGAQGVQHLARSILPWALACVAIAIAVAALWSGAHKPPPSTRPVMRWITTLPNTERPRLTMSQDGSYLAYVANPEGSVAGVVYLRRLDQFEAKPLLTSISTSNTDVGRSSGTFFSPDGRWIAYTNGGKLKKTAITGGGSYDICDTVLTYGADWGPDDTIVFGGVPGQGLQRVSASGGEPRPLTKLDAAKGESGHIWPHFLPTGKAVLFTSRNGPSFDSARIEVLDLRTGEQRVLIEGGSDARYSPSGHLIYARAGTLFAVPFDVDRLEVKGTPVSVLEGVSWIPLIGSADFALSNSGTLVYLPSNGQEEITSMAWVDRNGSVTPVAAPANVYSSPSLSPDGGRIAVSIGTAQSGWDIWVYDLTRGGLRRITSATSSTYNHAPVWTPDGKRLVFSSRFGGGKMGLAWSSADGSEPPQRLIDTDVPATAGTFLSGAKSLVFYRGVPGTTELMMLPLKPGSQSLAAGSMQRLIPGNLMSPQTSPDGQLLAYVSLGQSPQVFVQPLSGPGENWQVSTDGGTSPRWARNGHELFYRNGDKMMSVEIETKPKLKPGKPTVLFSGRFGGSAFGAQPGIGYDVSPDGKRFLMLRSASSQSGATEVRVVQDWFEELRRRVPVPPK
jgi:eukaryotic-like serine/threonine-protein kinase